MYFLFCPPMSIACGLAALVNSFMSSGAGVLAAAICSCFSCLQVAVVLLLQDILNSETREVAVLRACSAQSY